MCIAKDIVIKLNTLLEEVENEHKRLTKLQSDADKAQEDLLHEMELTTFNACEGYYLAKRMQDVRSIRRNAKDELDKLRSLKAFIDKNKTLLKKELSSITQSIKDQEIIKEKLTYTPRVLSNTTKLGRGYQKLNKVNKTKIVFHPEVDRIEEILKQIG